MKYLPVALLMFCSSGYSAEDCSQIENTQDRLTCFDEKFPRAESISITVEPKTNTEMIPEPESVAITTTMVPETEQKTEPDLINETAVEPAKTSFWDLFKKRDTEFTATVEDILNNDQQKMVFLLSNRQIWLQNTPRNLPIREGDEVTIKNGTVGGYMRRNSAGTSTRVSRIQ